MRRASRASVLALLGALFVARGAAAQKPPSAERIRSAAEEYDAGRRSFGDGKFEEAAAHFENAFHDAPSPVALRNAIRARKEAKQSARAATLATLAISKYPEDAATQEVAKATLAELEPKLHKVLFKCTPECNVAADGRAVSVEDAAEVRFYLDPGPHSLVVGWTEDRSKVVPLTAKAGSSTELSFRAPPVAAKAPPPEAPAAPAVAAASEGEPDRAPSTKPFGPAVFVVGAGLTTAGIVATIVSGVDTINNPGTDAVRRDCAGVGPTCPTYQKGLDAQTRTNVILGITIGVGVTTAIVGLFFTQWSSPAKAAKAAVRPLVVAGPTSLLGLEGRF
jgi:hypothetical protein